MTSARDFARGVNPNHPATTILTHWELSYEEVRASGRYTCRSDHAARPNPICRNGSFHAVTTRDARKVTCPACLKALKAAANV